ncbi:hypothetical protein MRX96_006324 [Rhipicephalus microplus]
MAGAASSSPQRHLDAADEIQDAAPDPGAMVPPRDVPARAPGRQNVPGEVPILSLAPTQSRGTFRRGRPGPAPARPTPLTARSRRSPWADKARERRESPGGDELNRGSLHASELDEMRRANEQLRKENAQLKQEMSRLAAEMAEIRKLASSPPSAQPAPAPVAMDTSVALRRP